MQSKLLYTLAFIGVWGISSAKAMPQYTQVCRYDMCEPFSFFDQNQVMKTIPQIWQGSTPRLTFCQADPQTRKCINDGLIIHGQSALMQVDVNVPFARILWAPQQCRQTFSMNLDYQIQANDFYPVSTMSPGLWTIGKKGLIQFTSPDFSVQITDLGKSQFSTHFTLDFIDFEQKKMGAYYTIVVAGDVVGHAEGYTLIQMSETGHIDRERPNPMGRITSHAAQTPLMQAKNGSFRMPNLLDPKQPGLSKQQILRHQSEWGVTPAFDGLYDANSGEWYANDEGAFAHVPLNQQSMHYKWDQFVKKTSSWWQKLLRIIYLEPEQ